MSSVNKIFIFLFIGIFSSSLYAVDVSNFDIKGIKLGMSKNEVLKRIPCKNYKSSEAKLGNGKISESDLICRTYNGNKLKENLVINFNHNNIVFNIDRTITFDVEPNFSKIKNKFIKKYGTPDVVAKETSYGITGALKAFCWGSCKIEKKDSEYGEGTTIDRCPYNTSNGYLYIDYNNYNPDKQTRSMEIVLRNCLLSRKNEEWIEEQDRRTAKQKKDKASNIDF